MGSKCTGHYAEKSRSQMGCLLRGVAVFAVRLGVFAVRLGYPGNLASALPLPCGFLTKVSLLPHGFYVTHLFRSLHSFQKSGRTVRYNRSSCIQGYWLLQNRTLHGILVQMSNAIQTADLCCPTINKQWRISGGKFGLVNPKISYYLSSKNIFVGSKYPEKTFNLTWNKAQLVTRCHRRAVQAAVLPRHNGVQTLVTDCCYNGAVRQ